MDTSWFHYTGEQHHISKAVSHAAILIYFSQASRRQQPPNQHYHKTKRIRATNTIGKKYPIFIEIRLRAAKATVL